MKELIERVKGYEDTKNEWRNSHESIEFTEASKVMVFLVGIPLEKTTNCGCVEDLFVLLKQDLTKKISMESERKYFLQKDMVLQNHKFPLPLTSDSSDEDLAYALEVAPEIAIYFDKIPTILNIDEVRSILTEKGVAFNSKMSLKTLLKLM